MGLSELKQRENVKRNGGRAKPVVARLIAWQRRGSDAVLFYWWRG
jgi:hypothetical protein